MLWLALPRQRRPSRSSLAVPPSFLLLGLVFLVGFRLVLNVTNGNVIDVGYSGVIGGDRLLHGEQLYGGFPPDNDHGDTYGPVAYVAYVPFVLAFPWGGGLGRPARRARRGRRVRPRLHGHAVACRPPARRPLLGLLLAYLWAACPFTLLVVELGRQRRARRERWCSLRSSARRGPRPGARWRCSPA